MKTLKAAIEEYIMNEREDIHYDLEMFKEDIDIEYINGIRHVLDNLEKILEKHK